MHNYLPAGAVARPPPRPPKPNPPGPRLAGPGCAAATATCSAASVDAVRCYPSLPARPETACQPHVAACEQPPGRDPAGAGQHRHRRSLRSPVSRSRTEVAAVWPSSRTPTRWIPPVSVAAQPRSSGRTLTRWAPPVGVAAWPRSGRCRAPVSGSRSSHGSGCDQVNHPRPFRQSWSAALSTTRAEKSKMS